MEAKVLDGKHICRILANGKLLICMPDSGGFIMRDHILMSLDHGNKWSVVPLNQTTVRTTVVSTESPQPRGKSNEFLRQNLKLVDGGSSSFLNYTNVLGKKSSPFEVPVCESSSSCAGSNADYEDWTLPDLDKQSLHYNGNGCILGSKDVYRRIKESSLAFGLVRRKELNDATSKCTLDMDAFAAMDFDKDKLENLKYDFDMSMKKTPGNKCIGNFTMPSVNDIFLHVEKVIKDQIQNFDTTLSIPIPEPELELDQKVTRDALMHMFEMLEDHGEKLGFIHIKTGPKFYQSKAFAISISLMLLVVLCLAIGFFVS
ncbi:hypothetical protein Ciccas_000519 [Cichlidogyrus casuarinus]|uniref:Uncharacterized protein n=1 Tax=Cichlidogyrus casuarinus TaxID=1844966 RepID=A0ABD2QMZ3_9PLAT